MTAPCALPPPFLPGALRLPCLARPVPFYLNGFFPEPAVVPLVRVTWVVYLKSFYRQTTTLWMMSLRRGRLKMSSWRVTQVPL